MVLHPTAQTDRHGDSMTESAQLGRFSENYMSTKLRVVDGQGSGLQKVGIELGSCNCYPNSIPTMDVPNFGRHMGSGGVVVLYDRCDVVRFGQLCRCGIGQSCRISVV